MDRRNFLGLLLNAPTALCLNEGKSRVVCGICGSTEVRFDNYMDINLCLGCGAHETAAGWQSQDGNPDAEKK